MIILRHLLLYTSIHAVAEFVKEMRYKPEVCGFDTQWVIGCIMALGSTKPLTERRPVGRAENLTTVIFRLSRNEGASTSWDT